MTAKQTLTSASVLALLVAAAWPAQAQDQTPTIQQLEQQLKAQRKALEETSRSLERLKIQMQAPGASAAKRSQAPQQAQNNTAVQEANAEPVGQAPPNPQQSAAAKVAPILDQPGILTPRGHLVGEPSLQYDYSSNNQVSLLGFSVLPAILVGLVNVRQVDTSSLMAAATFRYGLTNRLELNGKIPYVYSRQSTLTRPLNTGSSTDEVFNNSGHGVGDIQLGARYQFNQGGNKWPYLIGSLQASLPTGKGPFDVPYTAGTTEPGGIPLPEKQPTGSGFFGLSAGLLGIYPSDPAVFFGGLDYTWIPSKNVNKTIGGLYIGRVNPGDSIKLSFGMGISLNDKASFSVGYQHAYVKSTQYEGNPAANLSSLQVGQLLIGYGYQLTPKTNINLTLGVGTTRYAPNAELLLRIPMTF